MNLSDCLDQSHFALEKRAGVKFDSLRKGLGGAWGWLRRGGKALPAQAIHPGAAQGAAQGAARAPGAVPVIPHGPGATVAYPAPVPPPLPAGPNILSRGLSATGRGLKSKPAIGVYGAAGGAGLAIPVTKTISDFEADAWKVRETKNIADLAAGKTMYEMRDGWNRLSGLLPDANFLQRVRDQGMGGAADAYEAEDKYRQSEAQYQRGQVSGAKHWNREEELYKRHGDKLDLSWASRWLAKLKYPNV